MRKIEFSIITGLLLAFLLTGFSSFSAVCDNIRQDTLRLHILANSDSEYDQNLKLLVRDAILKNCNTAFTNASNKTQAVLLADENLQKIANTAKETLAQNGCDLPVRAYRTNMFFDTRYYDSFTLPAGKYDAIRVEIGNGGGKNWWCVLFPPLCVPAAEKADDDAALGMVYDEKEKKVVRGKYEIRFAIVELIEKIKK